MCMDNKSDLFDFRKKYEELHGEFKYTFDLNLTADKVALVIIDMQPAFVDSRYGVAKAYDRLLKGGLGYFERRVRELVIPNNRQLLKYVRRKKMLIVYIVTWSETDDLCDMPTYMKNTITNWEKVIGEQVYRKWNDGMNVCDEIAPQDHELVVAKRTASAFISSNLPMILQNSGIETVVLTGVNTNGCIFETAVGGKNMGFSFLLASDATACFAPWLQEVAELWMHRHFAAVHATNEIIEMLEQAEKQR